MKRGAKIFLFTAAGVLLAIAALLISYRLLYRMGPARLFEVGSPAEAQHLLIATQGSSYKDALVATVAEDLKPRHIYIRVIDVTTLPTIREQDWSAMVLVHTWEIGKPEESVETFVRRVVEKKKLIVLTTSGSGEEKLADVDALSSASRMADIPRQAAEISGRIDRAVAAAP
jgi:hypothetical protein